MGHSGGGLPVVAKARSASADRTIAAALPQRRGASQPWLDSKKTTKTRRVCV